MRTGNPALNDNVFLDARKQSIGHSGSMTIDGTVSKSTILLFLVMGTAYFSWQASFPSQTYGDAVAPMFAPSAFLWGGMIGGLVFALITIFKKTWAPVTAPIYAVFEGAFLGALSASFELRYPGIVTQAVFGTFGVFLALLMVYRSGMIAVTDNFRLGVAAATGGIFIVYMATMLLGFFGINIPYIHGSGIVGIGFSVFVIVIASMNLVLDFDFIENGEKMGAPKYMEWYAAFGLLVTLIWLYIEILHLLAKLRER